MGRLGGRLDEPFGQPGDRLQPLGVDVDQAQVPFAAVGNEVGNEPRCEDNAAGPDEDDLLPRHDATSLLSDGPRDRDKLDSTRPA